MPERLRVGILGATGAVGQTFVRLLADHPQFEVAALAASERSAGRRYREAVTWIGDEPIPPRVAEMTVQACTPDLNADFVVSGLDSAVAGEVEVAFARAGFPVISNARNHRMDPDVPLLIPEVNPDHAALIDRQAGRWRDGGFIVTNPNCSTVGLVMALKPLADRFGVEVAHVVTLQALSGAGYPGVSALDSVANVVPHIPGEEEKLAVEPRKLLGTLTEDLTLVPAEIRVSAQCTRVPVVDGHLECVSVGLGGSASPQAVAECFRGWRGPLTELHLPTAPSQPIVVMDDPAHPQPRRHAGLGGGMAVSVGRIQSCPVLGVRFVVLSHNTVRGAAGGALLNAELLLAQGRLHARRTVTA